MSDFKSRYKDLLSTFDLVGSNVQTPKEEAPLATVFEESGLVLNASAGDGVVFTDIDALAVKFSIPRSSVSQSIARFIAEASSRGFEWRLLDMSEDRWRNFLMTDKSPHAYHKALDAFTAQYNWKTTSDNSLFIIGGNDVIAIPQHVDSFGYEEYMTDEDYYYGFPLGFDLFEQTSRILVNNDGIEPFELVDHLLSLATFNVSRLPLDAGTISQSFGNTVDGYFARVKECDGKIQLNNVLMTTARQWTKASHQLSRGLPLVAAPDKAGEIQGGVYQSPIINLDRPETLINYTTSLGEANLLLFNLHGAPDYNVSAYFGDNGDPYHHEQPRAFDIALLDTGRHTVINSMACFGAKYTHQGRTMLLSSIYRDTLLFAGSSNISLGCQGCDSAENTPKYGCSEAFLRIYTECLMEGIPAGKAFLVAKLYYFADFLGTDGKGPTDLTFREFNLFGDPTIICNSYSKATKIPRNKYTAPSKYNPKGAIHNAYGITALSVLDSLLEEVRAEVDNNLSEISSRLSHYLHNDLGYNDVKFNKVESMISNSKTLGYRFYYSFAYSFSYSFRGVAIVETNLDGRVESVIYSK
ncbi:MAG: hypothetical protein IKX20_06660 [Paludibacteraceae bacterium]|nr:hypothetical protein [Paludibacteraceae bacterium]